MPPMHALFFSSCYFRPLNPSPDFTCAAITSTTSSSSQKPQQQSQQQKPWLPNADESVKMPTAPWMRSPLLLPASQVLHLSAPRSRDKKSPEPDDVSPLTAGVRGGRSHRAMLGIIRDIKNLQRLDPPDPEESSSPTADVKYADFSIPIKGDEDEEEEEEEEKDRRRRRRAPWVAAEEKFVFRREKKTREVTTAEATLPRDELFRLRGEAKMLKKWIKAKKAGVTQEVVNEVRQTWRENELAMIKIVEPLRHDMDRAREIVEIKTGGLVIWSKRDFLVVYKRDSYPNLSNDLHGSMQTHDGDPSSARVKFDIGSDECGHVSTKSIRVTIESIVHKDAEAKSYNGNNLNWKMKKSEKKAGESLYEREANRLLDELGPRFVDWWWRTPLPVDADLLPEFVTDFKPPLRFRPPNTGPRLRDDELTYLRKLARSLPTHFALGRNRKLQGLAAAITKLWEKSPIAKIAIKVGVPNTNNEQIASELKRLTGGVLLLRNKFFIILYRGKDFLPNGVASIVLGREKELDYEHIKEEEARSKAVESLHNNGTEVPSSSVSGTYEEFQSIKSMDIRSSSDQLQMEAEKMKLEKELRDQEHSLFILKQKIEKSEKELSELNSIWRPSQKVADQEFLTEEEKETLRNVGLRMDECLLLGRRGIYDGVIGSIHQHWKHREVVKLITRQKTPLQIARTAKLLEIESGGILISVEKQTTNHAIILYRGKNYSRPVNVLTSEHLSKREALQRSIEIQRRGSLRYFARQREQSILQIKERLKTLEEKIRAASSGDLGNNEKSEMTRLITFLS